MENKLKQLNQFKQVTLNDEERGLLRAHIARVMIEPPHLVTQSLFQRGVQHGLRIALSSLLFVIFVGGSVSAVANNALPGDPLYSFKLNVNEEIKGFFLSTPEQKVVWQKTRIESRVNEIKTLASSKTLTKAKQATVQKAIDNHIEELSKDLATLGDESPTTALSVTASLEESLKDGKAALENADTGVDAKGKAKESNPGTNDALKTVDDTIAKVSKQEDTIISKEIEKISDDVNGVSTDTTSVDGTTSTSVTPPPPSTPVGP